MGRSFPYKYGDRVVTVSSKAVQYPYGEMRKLHIAEGRYFEEAILPSIVMC